MNTLLRKILIPAAIFIASLTVLMFGDAAMRDFSARIVGKTLDFLPYAVGHLEKPPLCRRFLIH